jgi:hypothetical protein
VALCTHCLRLFTPDRRRAGRRAFCPKCQRLNKRNTYTQRDRRERIRTVLQLHREGKSVDEIVDATEFPAEQVDQYVDQYLQIKKPHRSVKLPTRYTRPSPVIGMASRDGRGGR